MKTFRPAPEQVAARVVALIKKYHSALEKVKCNVDLIFVHNTGDGPALTHSGYPAAALVRVMPPKDRAMGRGDAEIQIDQDEYEGMTDAERDALLDHELYHLEVAKTGEGKPATDDLGRPRLKLRKHDQQFGWFDEIARRHGADSGEVQQAREIVRRTNQLYFPFLLEVQPLRAVS